MIIATARPEIQASNPRGKWVQWADRLATLLVSLATLALLGGLLATVVVRGSGDTKPTLPTAAA